MKTIIVLTALAISCIFFFSETVMAWDELITNDTAKLVESGRVFIDGKLMYRTASKFYDGDSKSQDLAENMSYMSIPLRGKYSISDEVQTFAIIQVTSADDGVDSNTGIGDIWLGAKWAVRPDGLITIRGALDLPTGDDNKNLGKTGGFGLDAGFLTGIQNGPIDLNGQFGLRYNAKSSDTDIEPGVCVYLDGRAGYNFTEQISGKIGLEFMSWGESKVNGTTSKNSEVNWLEVSIGPRYKFNETIALFLDATYDILGKNTPLSTGAIIGFVYGY